MAHQNADTQGTGLRDQLAILRQHARIKDRRHVEASVLERNCRKVSIVVVGDQYRAIPDRYAEIHQVVAHGAGQHHTGNIVSGKAEGAFDGPGGGDHVTCPDAPQTVARACLGRCVIGQLFIAQDIAVVIDPCPHGARAQLDIFHLRKFFKNFLHELIHSLAIDSATIDRRAPAKVVGLFQQQHTRAAAACGPRGLQPRDPAADDQNVTVGVEMLVCILVPRLGCLAQTGGMADDRLINMFPRGCGGT